MIEIVLLSEYNRHILVSYAWGEISAPSKLVIVRPKFELMNSLCHAQAKHYFGHSLPLMSKFLIFFAKSCRRLWWVGGWQAISLTKRRLPPIVSDPPAAVTQAAANWKQTPPANLSWLIISEICSCEFADGFILQIPRCIILQCEIPLEILNDPLNVTCPASMFLKFDTEIG